MWASFVGMGGEKGHNFCVFVFFPGGVCWNIVAITKMFSVLLGCLFADALAR